jgi:hypothetical protein
MALADGRTCKKHVDTRNSLWMSNVSKHVSKCSLGGFFF